MINLHKIEIHCYENHIIHSSIYYTCIGFAEPWRASKAVGPTGPARPTGPAGASISTGLPDLQGNLPASIQNDNDNIVKTQKAPYSDSLKIHSFNRNVSM